MKTSTTMSKLKFVKLPAKKLNKVQCEKLQGLLDGLEELESTIEGAEMCGLGEAEPEEGTTEYEEREAMLDDIQEFVGLMPYVVCTSSLIEFAVELAAGNEAELIGSVLPKKALEPKSNKKPKLRLVG